MSTNKTITIEVGKHKVEASKRAVTLSKSGKSGCYDSIQWTTLDEGTFRIEFGSAGNSPFSRFSYDVSKNSSTPVLEAKPGAHESTAFKYNVVDSNGTLTDDPFVIIEQ